MTSSTTIKRRARRIASDEAHAWARNLRLGNAHAKYVLLMASGYVNGDGVCFVSIEALADDTELSADTVRKRLAWLETIGAIVRLPQWIDADGKRNSEGRGKRTTDEIRLLLDADTDEIEAKATGNGDDATPSQQQGVNADQPEASPPVSPRLAPGQPLHCSEGLISEPEPQPEESPQPPEDGGSDASLEGWEEFEKAWQEPILRQTIARQVWSALNPDERAFAIKAARGYVVHRKSQKKPPNVINAHTFLRERDAWAGFAAYAPPPPTELPPAPVFIAENSPDWWALCVMAEIAGRAAPKAIGLGDGRGIQTRALTPAESALAQFHGQPEAKWQLVREGTNECGAWKKLLGIEARQITTGFRRAEITPGRFSDNWPIKEHGLRVPTPNGWPPRKDGTLSTTGPPDTLMTDQDERDLKMLKA